MNDVLRQLLQLSPGIAAGLKGDGNAMQEFMQAYQQTDAQLRQQRERSTLLQQQGEDRTRAITRQTEQDKVATEQRGQADALQRLQIPGQLAELGGAGDTPEDAQRLIESVMPDLMKHFGQGTMAMGQPAVEMAQRTITARQKRQVKEYVDQALKTAHVSENPDADPELVNLPAHVQKALGKPTAKLSELQAFADLPVGKPQGKERMPAAAGSMEEFSDPNITPERRAQILQDRKDYMQSDDRPRVTVNTGGGAYPPQMTRRIDAIVKGFDAQPIVKRTQVMSEGVNFAQSLKDDTTNPADDQALIYAFAKVMDPDSVVREGEYATVQKYAQSWADRFGFDVKRIFSNSQFLTPQARQNMKATLLTKFGVEQKAYNNLRSEYGRKIDRITGKQGTGVDELTDFGAAFPQTQTPETKTPAQGGPKIGERRKIQGQLAEWDGKGWAAVK